jgi:hypothetical protein
MELSPGTFIFLHPDDVRTAIEERNMSGVSLMIILGKGVPHLEFENCTLMPVILTVPA